MNLHRRIVARSGLCRDCQACLLACSLHHEGQCSPGLARLRVHKDMARYEFTLTICRHCRRPRCLEACSSCAMCLDERGVVRLDDALCTRCGACADACRFGAIYHHEVTGRYLKCDLCTGRTEGPLCVALCPVGALTFAQSGEEG